MQNADGFPLPIETNQLTYSSMLFIPMHLCTGSTLHMYVLGSYVVSVYA